MAKFVHTELKNGRIKVSKQITLKLHGISWRIGTSKTCGKRDTRKAEQWIDDVIESHKSMSLDDLVDKYPRQYESSLVKPYKSNLTNSINQDASNRPLKLMIDLYIEHLQKDDYYAKSTQLQMSRTLVSHINYGNIESTDVRIISAAKLNDIFLQKYKDNNSKSMSAFNQYRRIWNRFFDWIIQEGYRDTHPLSNHTWIVPRIKKDTTQMIERVYNQNQLDIIYNHLDSAKYPYQQKRALQLMLDTGTRPSEAVLINNNTIEGAFRLSNTINKNSALYHKFITFYNQNQYNPQYLNLLKGVKDRVGVRQFTPDTLIDIEPTYRRMSDLELLQLCNTLRLIDKYPSADKYSDFNFVNLIDYVPYSDKSVTLDQFVINDDLMFISDVIPDIDSHLIIDDTIIRTSDTLDPTKTVYERKDDTKTEESRNRKIILNPRARGTIVKMYRDYINSYQQHKPIDGRSYYLLTDKGNFLKDSDLRYYLKKTLDDIKVSGISLPTLTPHDIRHSWATIKVGECVTFQDMERVSQMLGHADVTFTLKTYYHRQKQVAAPGLSDL